MPKFIKTAKKLAAGAEKQVLTKEPHKFQQKPFPKFDMKGRKVEEFTATDQNLYSTQERWKDTLDEHEPKLQPRTIRMKNMGYGLLAFLWYFGVISFIMYRVKGDDLDELEKEAMEKIKLSKIGQNIDKAT